MLQNLGLKSGCLALYSVLLKNGEIERKPIVIFKILFLIFICHFPEI